MKGRKMDKKKTPRTTEREAVDDVIGQEIAETERQIALLQKKHAALLRLRKHFEGGGGAHEQ